MRIIGQAEIAVNHASAAEIHILFKHGVQFKRQLTGACRLVGLNRLFDSPLRFLNRSQPGANRPRLIQADEPIRELDSKTSREFIGHHRQIVEQVYNSLHYG